MRARPTSVRTLLRALPLCAALPIMAPGAATAAEVIFTVDPLQSSASWTISQTTDGPFIPQSPGSLTAAVSGHYLVRFDPTMPAPPTIEFVPGHGYFELATEHVGYPGYGAAAISEPANFAGQTSGGNLAGAIRDLTWDFASAPLPLVAGETSADQTTFQPLRGELALRNTAGDTYVTDYTGYTDLLSGGTWALAESAPGSGNWTLSLTNGHYTSPFIGTDDTIGGSSVSTAQFGAANMANVDGSALHAEVLGGASSVGGVSVDFSAPTAGGTFTAQQIPNNTGLSKAALAAAGANGLFLASTGSLLAAPQIWNVDYDASLDGGTATLVFSYNPALLPEGVDPSMLGIWHFDAAGDLWEFGGIVDVPAHTIAYQTGSFSLFVLGVSVPEPAAWQLAACGLLCLAGSTWLRRRRGGRAAV